jgi:D-alanyl-D-alanine carboxypeptidase
MSRNARLLARHVLGLLLVAFVAAAHPAPAASQARASATAQPQVPVQALRDRLQARLDSIHAAGRFPGATAGVRLPDGTSFGLAVGLSDREADTAMRTDDRMLAGSVGKTFVAAVALQLVSEGLLDLDRPVRAYLGDEAWYDRLPNGEAITVRMLMTHSGWIVRYEFNPAFLSDLKAAPDRVWKPAELVSYVLGMEPPFAAGEGWTYSDTNYIILAMIVEKVTGSTLYREIQRRVLDPLTLTGTVPSDSRIIPGLIQGYAGPGNPFTGTDPVIVDGRFAINPQFEWAGGGYATTAHDLARWAADIYEGRAYDPELLGQALDGLPARELGRDVRYGLGVIIWQTPAGLAYGHSGFFPGYLTEMRYFPEHRFAVALQVNTSVGRAIGRSPGSIVVELARIIREELSR